MHTIRRPLEAQAAVLIALALLATRGAAAQAPEYAVLYSFKGDADGAEPNGVILENGKLYGTTFVGGANICGLNSFYPCGTVFELTPVKGAQWTKAILFSFNGTDGSLPSQGLSGGTGPSPIFGSNGVLYGTTQQGGSNAGGGGLNPGGTVYALAPPTVAGGAWTENVLYSFSSSENAQHTPFGGLLLGSSGELFGTTYYDAVPPGGSFQGGTVFVLTPPTQPGGTWTERGLVNFETASLGMLPLAGVVALGGSLYGTNWESGGEGGCGTVYEMSPPAIAGGNWTGTLIHSFGGPPSDGCNSGAPLTVGPGGVLYGTSYVGGSASQCTFPPYFVSGCGTVFQLTPPAMAGGGWTENVIYNFTGTDGDGAYPGARVAIGKGGALYGTTTYGGSATSGSPCTFFGANGCGTVFELTPPTMSGGVWTETILHSFTGLDGDGSDPGPLFLSATGVLYGATVAGGSAGQGTIFAVQP